MGPWNCRVFLSLCRATLILVVASGFAACAGPGPLEEDEGENTSRNTTTSPTDDDFSLGPPSTLEPGPGDTTGIPTGMVDQCQSGEQECIDDTQYHSCAVQESGNVWDVPMACEHSCAAQTGSCCGPGCTLGATRCDGAKVQACELVEGCPTWGVSAACPGTHECVGNGVCSDPVGVCASNCDVGQLRCETEGGTTYKECVAVAPGCFQFPPTSQACPADQVCQSGGCVAKPMCTDTCITEGQILCATGQQKECKRSVQGCLAWADVGSCTVPGQPCYSTTLQRAVNAGECVQTAATNQNSGCSGAPGCQWAFCDNNTWLYQCTPPRQLGMCAGASVLYGHATCP